MVAQSPLLLPLYRALLRTARRYDKDHALRTLLSAPRHVEFDITQGSWSPLPPHTPATPSEVAALVGARAVHSLCGGGRLYIPPASGGGGSLQRALGAALREAIADDTTTPELLPDAGFELLRRLEASAALGDRILAPPPPAAAAAAASPSLPRRAAGDGPASGDILLSHPLMRRDVCLLLAADGADGFAFGLVTNAPTAARLGGSALLGGGPGRRAPSASAPQQWTTGSRKLEGELAAARRTRDDELRVFANSVVFYGGPDGTANLTMLHPHGQLRGCAPVRDGLFYGGELGHAAELVRAGAAQPSEFCFFRGRVDWQPGQLRGELDLGEWVLGEGGSGGAPWPPAGVLPRAASLAASGGSGVGPAGSGVGGAATGTVDPLDPADGGGGGGGGGSAAQQRALQRYRIAAWSHVAHALGLREWLRMRQLLPDERSELEALQRAGAAGAPAWRASEDWPMR